MALEIGTTILDGRRCKIVTVTALDNDPAISLALTFVGVAGATCYGMTTDLQGAPLECGWTIVASAADIATDYAIIAMAATGFTIRKLTAGGVANAKTIRVTLRLPRGIGS